MKQGNSVALVALITLATALPALAAPKDLSSAVNTQVARTVAQQETSESPFEIFTRGIQTVKNPEAAALLKVLQPLTAYNQVFETETDQDVLRRLAAKLEGPIEVPWNTYRGNGLKEIFDNYIPNSHGNKALADLEYYVKFYTLSKQTHNRTHIVSKVLPAYFTQSYQQLKENLAHTSVRDDRELIVQIAAFLPAYNSLEAQDAVVAQELVSSLFEMPIKTGWDRTYSLKELAFQIGVDYYSEGYNVRSAEQLLHQFGINYTEAELVESFVRSL